MAHELPPLPYPNDALEPHIDARTMEIHHDKHHNAYVTNLNNAIAGNAELEAKSIEDLIADLGSVPDDIRGRKCATTAAAMPTTRCFGRAWGRAKVARPPVPLGDAIIATFESFDAFKEAFAKAGITRFWQRLGVAERRQWCA